MSALLNIFTATLRDEICSNELMLVLHRLVEISVFLSIDCLFIELLYHASIDFYDLA